MRIIGPAPTAALYAATAVLASAGMMLRYRNWAPWGVLIGIFVAHVALYVWLRAVAADYWIDAIAGNMGCALIFAVAAVGIRNHVRNAVDRAIYWLYVFICLELLLHPMLLIASAGGALAAAGLDEQQSTVLLHLAVGSCATVMGVLLLRSLSHEAYEEMQQHSCTDRLSGLLNRRGFDERAEEILELGDSDVRFASAIVAGIDNFKAINDLRSRVVGDMIIAEFGALFADYVDGGRVAARLGGDRFVMLLPGEMMETAIEIARAIRRDFSETSIDMAGGRAPVRLSASFGVVQRQSNESLSRLLSRAEDAMRLAKASGRDCVCTETDLAVDKLQSTSDADALSCITGRRMTASPGAA